MSGLQERRQPGTLGAPTVGNVQKAVAAPPRTPAKEMQIAFSTGGRTDVTLIPRSISLNDFFGQLSWPGVGSKDGSYYIRGGDLLASKRSDENLKYAELIILDGDSRIDPETGEVTPGAPPMRDVTKILDTLGIVYIAHTTHSYKVEEYFWKYRVIIPAPVATPKILSDCVEYFIDTLHDCGVWLNDVPENRRWSQPWYLPRVATEADLRAFQCVSNFDAEIFDHARATKWVARKRAEDEVWKAAKKAAPAVRPSMPEGPSIIDDFNKSHDLVWVRAELENHGYRFSHFSAGKGVYRYIAPRSETGEAGLVVFQGAQGDWCTYSHHGSHDPLSGRLSDPFELYATFEHNGDKSAAARRLADETQKGALLEASRQFKTAISPPPNTPKVSHIQSDGAHPTYGAIGSANSKDVPSSRIKLVRAANLEETTVKWLVHGMIPQGGMAALYGKPGAYKSFIALYIAASVAAGTSAFDRETEQSDVLYIAGEGHNGVKARWDALIQHHKLPSDIRLDFVQQSLDLRSGTADLLALIEAINATDLKPRLIIIDTLFRMFAGGNENASEDMGAFIALIGQLQEALGGCAILIVHHCGKDEARGLRGHSSLLAAIDTELEVTKTSVDGVEPRTGKIHCSKMKDGDDGWDQFYKVPLIVLPSGHIMEPRSSLAIEPCDESDAPAKPKPKKKTKTRDLGLDALNQALNDKGEIRTISGIPSGVRTVHADEWRAAFYSIIPSTTPDKRHPFDRAVKALLTQGVVACRDDWNWIIGDSKRPVEDDF